MRRTGFALLVVACISPFLAISRADHIGISELNPRTYMVFRDPSDGSVITTGSVKCYEAEWDTALADDAGYAYKFTRYGTGSATHFIFDNMPQTNCLTCYHRDGATVVCCAESLRFEGKALADSALTSWTQIKANAITRACLDGGENYAWHTEIADSNFFVPNDTVWVNALLATHTWVLEQGYAVSGATAATVEFMNDAIWGDTYPVAAGQASSTVDVVYDDAANTVTFNLANESVTSAQVDDLSLHARELMYSETYGPSDKDFAVARWHDPYYKIAWRSLEDFVEDGDDLIWGTPTGSYLYRLDYNGSGGASQAQIKDWAVEIFSGGSFDGLTKTVTGSGETAQIDIDASAITSAMITNYTIAALDIEGGNIVTDFEVPTYDNGTGAIIWRTLQEQRDNAPYQRGHWNDDVGEVVDGGTQAHIGVAYNGATDRVNYSVLLTDPSGIDYERDVIIPHHFYEENNTYAGEGDIPVVHYAPGPLARWHWHNVRDLIEPGTGLTVSTGSTTSACSLLVDFSLIDWPASVSTIQILVADIWRAEIDTLEAGRVTMDSLSVLGTRWDDGAGKIIAAAFPDSADFSSVSTVALYIDGTRAVERFVELADSTVKAGGYTTQQWIEDNLAAGVTFTDQEATPSTVATLLYNNNAKGLDDGAMVWFDDDSPRFMVDLEVLPVTNDDVVTYNAATDKFYMKAPPGAGGGDAWGDAVDADIVPVGADDTYDLGSAAAQFKDGYFDGTLEADIITLAGALLYDWAASATTIHTNNYVENVSTALSAGTVTATTYGITSDGGADDIVLPEADTNNAGLLGADKWDEIVANNAKVTDDDLGVNEVYGAGWNGDADSPEKDDVYDYLHLIDTDDDGDVDNIDEGTSATWAGRVSDETGSGVWVFGTSPRFTTQIDVIGTASISTSLVTPLVDANGAALTIGDNDETIAINSSDWDITATGIATGFGNITSDGTIEGATLTEGGTAVYNTTESDAAYQPLEATLTDIADGTIAENLVNTAHPWADNEVADVLTLSTVSGAVDMASATSIKIPTGNDPAASAEGHVAWDWNDDAFKVYMGDEGEAAFIPAYQKLDALIFAPDGVNDQVAIMHVDALLYPHGIEIDQLSITLPADAAYSMVFEEWAGDPPVHQNDIDTVTTGGTDSYMEDGTPTDGAIDADDYIFLDIPATDVDWIHVHIIYHVTAGN